MGPRGERCRLAVPFGHSRGIGVTARLRARRLTATTLFDGPMSGVPYRCDVEEISLPIWERGDTAVLDNQPAQKVRSIRPRIEAPGCSTCRPTRTNREGLGTTLT